jgi:hypothetical protein
MSEKSPCRTLALPGPTFSVIDPSLSQMFASRSASTHKRKPCVSEPNRLQVDSYTKISRAATGLAALE